MKQGNKWTVPLVSVKDLCFEIHKEKYTKGCVTQQRESLNTFELIFHVKYIWLNVKPTDKRKVL